MATLSGLEIESLDLNPAFQPNVFNYTATAPADATYTGTVRLTKQSAGATIGFADLGKLGYYSRTSTSGATTGQYFGTFSSAGNNTAMFTSMSIGKKLTLTFPVNASGVTNTYTVEITKASS